MATNIDKIARQLESLRRQAYGDYITIAGVKLRYLEMGSGSPVILIHGLGGFLEMWWNTILALSTKHRVYAFDMPGATGGCYIGRAFLGRGNKHKCSGNTS